MFVASELLKRDGASERLSARYPWTVSFSFGLLHGFGFAGALREIGMPAGDVPLALPSFNIGVELGQIIFLAAVILVASGARLIQPAMMAVIEEPRSDGARLVAYAIGGISAFWFVERAASFLA